VPKRLKKAPSTTIIQNRPSKKPPYTISQTEALLARANDLRLNQFASQHRVPASLAHFTAKDGHEYDVQLSSSDHIGATLLGQLCDLVEETSAEDYEKSSRGWHYCDKKAEMRHPHMKFLLPYEKEVEEEEEGVDEGAAPVWLGSSLTGFCSFMLCREKRVPVIYIYEIHLFNRDGCRGNGVGKKLMELVETIGRRAGVVKSMLTVFTTNVRAEGFYRSLGYSEDQVSPRIRVLKNGKVKKPEYFILSKDLEGDNGADKRRDKDTEGNRGDHEVVQVDVEKVREEEDVALPIYDATDLPADKDILSRSESSENLVLLC
jgi:ribosomal protein S18 acetylase RimI-like enzyme